MMYFGLDYIVEAVTVALVIACAIATVVIIWFDKRLSSGAVFGLVMTTACMAALLSAVVVTDRVEYTGVVVSTSGDYSSSLFLMDDGNIYRTFSVGDGLRVSPGDTISIVAFYDHVSGTRDGKIVSAPVKAFNASGVKR